MREKALKGKGENRAGAARDWKGLGVHPAFLKWAEIYQVGVRELNGIETQQLPLPQLNKAKSELMSKISKRIDAEVRPLMPNRIKELAGLDIFYGVSFESLKEAQKKGTRRAAAVARGIGLQEFDAQNRFHKPLHAIVQEHLFGNRGSTSEFMKLENNRQAVRYGVGLPTFKGNIDHRILMQTGLGLGLEGLSSTELECFYNEFCPCREDHDADDLRKLRRRIRQEGREARDSVTAKFKGTNQTSE